MRIATDPAPQLNSPSGFREASAQAMVRDRRSSLRARAEVWSAPGPSTIT